MPRSSTVSEDVWMNAIHAVNVEKMSLRRAAQRYGVHHMSLHRRIRSRSSLNPSTQSTMRKYLTLSDEAEALAILRDQYMHVQRVGSDNVRMVVRAICSQGGCRTIPSDFPPDDWVKRFKRVHGFSSHGPRFTSSGCDRNSNDNMSEVSLLAESESHKYLSQEATSNHVDRSTSSTGSCDSMDSGITSGGDSANTYEGAMEGSQNGSREEKVSDGCDSNRGYRQSYTVTPDTWAKAIASVEEQGMSLRAAARVYGVHFAALHRRIRKRTLCAGNHEGIGVYFQPNDEALIVRIVGDYANLGVPMAFEELISLIQRAALIKLPNIAVNDAQKLLSRFQKRNACAIRHLVRDWPTSENVVKTNGSSPLPLNICVIPSTDMAQASTYRMPSFSTLTLPRSTSDKIAPFRSISVVKERLASFQTLLTPSNSSPSQPQPSSSLEGITSIAHTVMALQHGDLQSNYTWNSGSEHR
uniref:Uncharacterized protein AlNc14C463G11790 n=1 Tax=Albugo laibachii Nc14 TaxID=890382 RepID=F0X052_9STRA|nr:conserved hypothetical protein [Albugo laibachii Nc14]|eukprot:CCA27134.1 conserved hypothetical protein [Albugo laibachii Nc14]